MSTPAWKGKLSILLLDSSDSMIDHYRHKIVDIFKAVGYAPMVTAVVSGPKGDEVLSPDLFDKEYFDVVVCDVSLGDDVADKLGLQTLRSIRKSYPGIYTIAYSRNELDYEQSPSGQGFDLFINKRTMANPPHARAIVAVLSRTLRINANAYVQIDPDAPPWPGFETRHLIDLNRIVRKLTFTGIREVTDESVGRVRLKEMPGGLSGAIVLQMRAYTEVNFSCVQALLKLAKTDDVPALESLRNELARYNSYVRWYLPYRWRPELLGGCTEGSLSALCYAFVTSDDEPFHTLSALASKADTHLIDAAIESIFDPNYQRWYHRKNVEMCDVDAGDSLKDFYLKKCFGAMTSYAAQTRVFRQTMRAFDEDGQTFIYGGQQCMYPERSILGEPAGPYLSCLIHGDLNTRNVFISGAPGSRDVTLIDFSETGRGHVYFDFIVFEVNLRIDMAERTRLNLSECIDCERQINAEADCAASYAAPVRKLRRYAKANFPDERFDTYLYGMAAFCFSLLNARNLTPAQVKMLTACVSAALLDLQQRRFWSHV